MKLSKEELKKKINETIEDDDVKITLLEDIEDSFDVEADNSELEEVKTKYEELKTKYKERFLTTDNKDEDEEKEETEELEEKEVIDIKEI